MSADDEFRVVTLTRTQRNMLASLQQTWPHIIEPVVSAWDKTPARPAGSTPLTLRQLIERALIRIDEGSPRSFVRLNLMNALKRLDEAERVYVIGNDYGDYCCDCGTGIRFQANSPGSADDIHGRFVPDPDEAAS